MRWLLGVLLLLVCAPLAIPPAIVYKPITASDCLAWVIHDEARGESLKGARAVLDVVLARAKRKQIPVCKVVAEPKQFSGYRPGVLENISQEALTRYEAVRKMSPVAANCEYFHATYVRPPWVSAMRRCKKVGNHIFYKPSRRTTHERKSSKSRH